MSLYTFCVYIAKGLLLLWDLRFFFLVAGILCWQSSNTFLCYVTYGKNVMYDKFYSRKRASKVGVWSSVWGIDLRRLWVSQRLILSDTSNKNRAVYTGACACYYLSSSYQLAPCVTTVQNSTTAQHRFWTSCLRHCINLTATQPRTGTVYFFEHLVVGTA